MNLINSHTQRLDQLQEARKLYQELRWRLKFLESVSEEHEKEPAEEEIIKWHNSIRSAHWN